MTSELEKKENTSQSKEEFDASRRDFLKVAVTVSAVLAVGGVGTVLKAISNPAPPSTTSNSLTFPRVKVGSVSELQVSQPTFFNYPLDNEPNILVKLGQRATGGVGPQEDIVAFSQICQHLGCLYSFQAKGASPVCNPNYSAPGPVGYCCCHGTIFDFTQAAKVIGGPSPRPAPQVLLEVDSSGNIFATGMGPPTVFGHNTGSNDVRADLQGGNLVG